MKKPHSPAIEIDMVPMIDVVTLLLMFLIIVGDISESTREVEMKLPRADQAIQAVRSDGRLVIQMQPRSGSYDAIINRKAYDLVTAGSSKTLIDYLDDQIQYALGKEQTTKNSDGSVNIPVKLRIPEGAPMKEVERLVMTLAKVGLTHVQYAAVK
jgi:biopolymer transport protein ExbD